MAFLAFTPVFHAVSTFTGHPHALTCKPRPIHIARHRITPSCTAAAPSPKGKKKVAPIQFAKDLKGNPVWNLRPATSQDVSSIAELVREDLPTSIVSSLIEDSNACVVCDASVKGRKEGEGYVNQILGAVLVDVSVKVKDVNIGFDSGLMKTAQVIKTVVRGMPDVEDVRKKMVMGSLKKLKEDGVGVVTVNALEDERAFFEDCLFKESKGVLTCRLASENPDPKKKML